MKTFNVIEIGSQREVLIGTVKASSVVDADGKAQNKYNRAHKYETLRVELGSNVTVHYTEAKTVKGELFNFYKSRNFDNLSAANAFADGQRVKSNVTDVRVLI